MELKLRQLLSRTRRWTSIFRLIWWPQRTVCVRFIFGQSHKVAVAVAGGQYAQKLVPPMPDTGVAWLWLWRWLWPTGANWQLAHPFVKYFKVFREKRCACHLKKENAARCQRRGRFFFLLLYISEIFFLWLLCFLAALCSVKLRQNVVNTWPL